MPQTNYFGLIMAGGRGTRFWPRSRAANAKQVLRLTGELSLIQETVERLKPLIPPERIWIITNDLLRKEIIRQLPQVPANQIIAEPAARNTAPCIGLAAEILSRIDPNAIMGVFPADHLVTKPKRFLQIVKAAFQSAEKDQLTVVGVQPRWPETGYGYIEFPKGTTGSLVATPVKSFREKPDLATAKKYVKTGRFFWNSGMFFWKTSVILDALRRYQPKTATLLSGLPNFGSSKFNKALQQVFPKCESISIDYAVIEKAAMTERATVTGIAADDFGWNDLGSWNAVYDVMGKDAADNATRGDVLIVNGKGNYVETTNVGGRVVALVGVENLVVVDTPDALLVVPRDRAQDVGQIVKLLEKQGRHKLI
jgi:mannose-1-phosphate guanylyltransferase